MQEGANSRGVRRAPRLATRLLATLQGRNRFDVEVLDLSLSGCLARGPSWLDSGLVMDLTLAIPGETLAAKVRVAMTSRDGEANEVAGPCFLTGLEFLMLPPGGEQVLQRFLDQERRRRRAER
jgi:hypothetical protein